MSTCTMPGCDRPLHVKFRGLCRSHYLRWYRHGDPLAGGTAMNATVEWLLSHVGHKGAECLTWPFSTNGGYGQTWWNGKPALASRVMCTLAHGEPPTPEHHAAHSCGKGDEGCVHPEHLSWKTPLANQHDKFSHGTTNRGDRHGMSKLTADQVTAIRSLRSSRSTAELSRQFGVTQKTINGILAGRSWAWLPHEEGNHVD